MDRFRSLEYFLVLSLFLAILSTVQSNIQGSNTDEDGALNLLIEYDREAPLICNELMRASWQFTTNVTNINKRIMLEKQKKWMSFHRRKWKEAVEYAWKDFKDPNIKRAFSFITVLDRGTLSETELNLYMDLLQDMKSLYATTKVCRYDPSRRIRQSIDNDVELIDNDLIYYDDYDGEDEFGNTCTPTLSLEPDLTELMRNSRDHLELRYYWKAWRDAVGRPLREKYLRFVELSNKAATRNGFNDAGEFLRKDYETDDFKDQLEKIWIQLQPLYQQLHAYVRRKLREQYGDQIVPEKGPIPGHLLGNMWGQSWTSLLDIAIPYKGRTPIDVTDRMRRQNMNVGSMFAFAENFFVSLGLNGMTNEFWTRSMFTKPRNRKVVCHASAWDFCDKTDFRIRQCTKVTMEDFITVHHEMGHIQYHMMYKDQPFVFREGANPGFHEAVGDAIALSVASPDHLKKINLLDSTFDDSYENQINFLFSTALDKIAFLPFGYLLDLWRWELYEGSIDERNLNERWWELRLQYQGISPPIVRSEEDFDPASKFHVPANIPYIRYFVSFIIQFQFHSALCKAAGHTGPLHLCDIYGSKKAGDLLKRVLQLGKSRPWPEALSILTNGDSDSLDATPILEYFSPLMTWLESENRNEHIGWIKGDEIIAGLQVIKAETIIGASIGMLFLLILVGSIIGYSCWRFKAKRSLKSLTPVPS